MAICAGVSLADISRTKSPGRRRRGKETTRTGKTNLWNTREEEAEIEPLISPKRTTQDHDIKIAYIDGTQAIKPTPQGNRSLRWADDQSNGEIPDVGDATFDGVRQEWCDLYDAMTESERNA